MDVPQEDRNLGMILHGLVALTGLASIISAIGIFALLSPIASVILYFVWKTKSPFVVRHAKQAAGVQVFLFVIGILLGILGGISLFLSAASGSVAGMMATGGLLGIIGLVIGIFAVVVGIMGLLKAQKGEEFTYPIIGQWVDGLNI